MRAFEAVATASAVRAAADTGVLAALGEQPQTEQLLARSCGLTPRGARALVAALVAIGVCTRDADGRVVLADPTVELALRSVPGSERLAEVLRGASPAVDAGTVAGAAHLYPDLVDHLRGLFGEPADEVARLVGPATSILDVGAGAGTWGIACARANPGARLTLNDLPAVLPLAARAARDAGIDAVLAPGDAFVEDLGSHDLVILGNVCHLFSPARAAALIDRAAGWLAPGGTLAIVDVLGDDADGRVPAAALYALGLLLRAAEGDVHAEADYRRWCDRANLRDVEVVRLRFEPLSLARARRT